MTRHRIDSFFSGLIGALTGAPRYLCLPNVPFPPSSDKKAAGVLGTSSTGNVIDPCRCVKTLTADVVFSCICGDAVKGILTMNQEGAKIRCSNCGCVHYPTRTTVIPNTNAVGGVAGSGPPAEG